ncbi:hypothetical protein B0H14DRAFT_441273 [Mycena olivaceomarginata]|nr:hypothetical protein B0H14DRAFT_441273 [Mycena olivaceomarginata]
MGSPLTDAHSYGLFLESIFYGIYLVTCGACLKTLLFSGDRLKPVRELKWAMLVVVFILFGLRLSMLSCSFTKTCTRFRSLTVQELRLTTSPISLTQLML